MVSLLTPLLAAATYLGGLFAHELTHVIVAIAGRCRRITMQLYPPTVIYEAPSTLVDELVRSSTIVGTVAVLAVYFYQVTEYSHSLTYHILAVGFIAGYFPRSGSDWEPIAPLLARLT